MYSKNKHVRISEKTCIYVESMIYDQGFQLLFLYPAMAKNES